MAAKNSPFCFIVGAERSGTTLLRSLVNAHSRVAIPPESHFVVPILRDAWRFYDHHGSFSHSSFIAEVTSHPRWQKWGIDSGDAVTSRIDGLATVAEGLRCIYQIYADSRGKPQYADKTPAYSQNIPLLAGWLPEARFIHIVRDGRDVAASLASMEWFPGSVIDAAQRWKSWVITARRDGLALAPGRYMETRYEALVADPSREMAKICGFMRVEFEASMLQAHEQAENLIADALSPESHAGLRQPPQAGFRDWREELTLWQQRMVEGAIGEELQEFGYDLLHPNSRILDVAFRMWRRSKRLKIRYVAFSKGRFLK